MAIIDYKIGANSQSEGYYGNGVILDYVSGTIEIVVPPFVAPPTADTFSPQTVWDEIAMQCTKVLNSVGALNIWHFPMPPMTTEEVVHEYLRVGRGSDTAVAYQGWFMSRPGINAPTIGAATQYTQQHRIQILGVGWEDNYETSRSLMQIKGEQIARTLEKNKGLGLGGGAELRNVSVSYDFRQLGRNSNFLVYTTLIEFVMMLMMQEPAGRNVS